MIKLKINIDLGGYKAGTIIDLATDSYGNIFDNFWARRLKDSKIDNCVEIVNDKIQNKIEIPAIVKDENIQKI